jgi:hypothetical protein
MPADAVADAEHVAFVVLGDEHPAPYPGSKHVALYGRFFGGTDLALLTTASRFHPASIAGLAVGAMGCFVFSVAFRHWLRERRAWRDAPPA